MKKNKKDIIIIIIYLLLLTLSAIFLPRIKDIGFYLFLLETFISTILLVLWHSKTHQFICSHCNNEFSVSFMKDLLSPHNLNGHYLKCPHCGKKSWTTIVKKIKE